MLRWKSFNVLDLSTCEKSLSQSSYFSFRYPNNARIKINVTYKVNAVITQDNVMILQQNALYVLIILLKHWNNFFEFWKLKFFVQYYLSFRTKIFIDVSWNENKLLLITIQIIYHVIDGKYYKMFSYKKSWVGFYNLLLNLHAKIMIGYLNRVLHIKILAKCKHTYGIFGQQLHLAKKFMSESHRKIYARCNFQFDNHLSFPFACLLFLNSLYPNI